MGFVSRKLHISPNVFGGSRGTASPNGFWRIKEGGKGGTLHPIVKADFRKITKGGVGKFTTGKIDGLARVSRGETRPVVQGMDTQGKVVKKAKKYWMWIVAAIIGYFILKGK